MRDIIIEITVPVVVRKKARACVALCPCLDVCSQGGTEEEARSNIGEALKAFLTTCYERGTLDEAFKQCGFEVAGPRRPGRPLKNAVTVTLRLSSAMTGTDRCRI